MATIWIRIMTSSNGTFCRVTGPLCRESTDDQWIHKGQWRWALTLSLICAWSNGWANNRDTGDLKRHRAHYVATVMIWQLEAYILKFESNFGSCMGPDWAFYSSFHYGDVIMSTIGSQITSLASVYSIVYSDADQRIHQSSASLAFVRGIHRGPVNSSHKWPVTRKMFPFDDVIMIHLCCSQ